MGRRTRLLSITTPEPTSEERLHYLNVAVRAIREDDVNKTISAIPHGVDVKTVYNFKLLNPKKVTIQFRASLLHLAIMYRSHNCTKFLLHLGAPKEASESSLGDHPLHSAVRIGSTEALKLLLEYGANVTSFNKRGDTALHIAARKGDFYMTKELLENGAEVSTQNRYGETPCYSALITGTPFSMMCVDLIRNHE